MCGIGGILRIVQPGQADYPPEGAPLHSASGAWLWQGDDPRNLAYSRIAGGPTHQPPFLIPESWLDAIDEGIKWRGPDGAGRFRQRVIRPDRSIVEVALVHRRLSIIDHAFGGQPMVVTRCPRCAERAPGKNDSGPVHSRSAVVFNGCIYNHRELRAELEALGHTFDSDHSDTEVILHGWHEGAAEFLDRFDGMYALVIWDATRSALIAARDQAGEKPIVAAGVENSGLFFAASTLPALTGVVHEAHPEYRRPWNRGALVDWIAFGYSPDETPFEGLYMLPPSAIATTEPLKSEEQPSFWDRFRRSKGVRSTHALDQLDMIDAVDALLASAVESRLEADVPLGCFLSGGVDSSLITWYAHRALGQLETFCVRMPEERFDESFHAERVAAEIGTLHTTVDVSPDAASDLVHIIETLGLPFADSSILPTYWLSKEVRRRVKVALSGDGGDELFAGYDRYRALPWGRPPHVSMGLMLIPVSMLDRSEPGSRSERLARLVVSSRHRGYTDLVAVFPTPDLRRLVGDASGNHFRTWRFFDAGEARSFDFTHYLPGDLLRKVDTASMMCGLEVRCPFLSTELVSRAVQTDISTLMPRGRTKHLLKELVRKHLPREIADRPKQGFAIPISDWWRTNFGGLQDLLLDMLAGERPFGHVHDVLAINMPFVRRMIDEHWAAGGLTPLHTTRAVRPRDHGQRLFALVSLAIWARSIQRHRVERDEAISR